MKLQEKFTFLEKQRSAVLATIFYNFETPSGVLPAAFITGNSIIIQATLSFIHLLVLEMTFTFACTGYDSEIFDTSKKSFSKNAEGT